jgi:hypothetical protein
MSGDVGGVLSLRPRIYEYIFDEFIGRTCSIIFNINFVNIFDIKFNNCPVLNISF